MRSRTLYCTHRQVAVHNVVRVRERNRAQHLREGAARLRLAGARLLAALAQHELDERVRGAELQHDGQVRVRQDGAPEAHHVRVAQLVLVQQLAASALRIQLRTRRRVS